LTEEILKKAVASEITPLDDREFLEAKYREERDKRIQPEGLAQYISVEGSHAPFADDPYAAEPAPRPARSDLVEVVMIGAGVSGVQTSVELRKAGVNDFLVIDQAADFGGVWYWNRYPGVRCDCESYIYLPFLEETGFVPSEKYSRGDEIHNHLRSLATKYDLYENAVFQANVTAVRWSDGDDRWVVRTNRGDEFRTRYLVIGSGPLHRPKLPGLPGLDDFEGMQFHSSRWNYDYTGGNHTGGLTKLRDKRVAVVGTGASAIQIIPAVARDAEHLYVVQRTPALVDERNNAPTDADWFRGQAPGWQQERMRNFDAILAGLPQDDDLVGDRWTAIWGGGAEAMATGSLEAAMVRLAEIDLEQMNRVRARVDAEVDDPATAAALKPYYGRFCKRPLFSDDYLTTFNRPNVTLIDTQGRGLDRLTRTGIVFDGQEYPVDLIVYASGFEFGVAATRTGGFEVHGPDGSAFTGQREGGYHSLHGMQFRGFPNLFVIAGLHQAAVSINTPLVFGYQAHHIAQLVKDLGDRGVVRAEVTAEAEKAWCEVIATRSVYNVEAARGCTPGAYNNENTFNANTPSVFETAFGGGPLEYQDLLARWRGESVEQDLELVYANDSSEGTQ
jgi:cation diffusion facilitator CzcD-associated flavoprotein CzcO